MIDRKKVLEFATLKHEGQKRKDGKDYITHPIAVAGFAIDIFDSIMAHEYNEQHLPEFRDELYAVSLLHDTYEDTDTTYEELVENFGQYIADSVLKLSRKDGQTYFDFIMSIVDGDWLVVFVKLADIHHNLSDLKEGSLKDKYRFAEHLLKAPYVND